MSMTSEFLHGPALTTVIKEILAEDGARAAVAFWGRGCEGWVTGKDAKIIANLRMGGTNPRALKKVPAQLKRCDRLHAKVYLGATRAVVGSANASVNGLAMEGAELASWIEAGLVTRDTAPILEWFEDLWFNSSHDISKEDWAAAETAWGLRPRARPTLPFADFDPDAEELPLLTWGTDDTWTIDTGELEVQFGRADKAAQARVDDGIGVAHPDDEKILSNKWVLIWDRAANGRASKGKPWFTQTSDVIIRNGFSYDSDNVPSDVVLAPEQKGPSPFDPHEPHFIAAFKDVIARPKYERLHDDEIEGTPWFSERLDLMRAFWSDVKSAYWAIPAR